MSQFQMVTYAREILFGAGSLEKLPEIVGRYGWKRLVLFGSPSMRREGIAERAQDMLGERLVGIYDQVQAHVQDFQLDEALALADNQDADAVIGLGGGSPIGIAKAVSLGLEDQRVGKQDGAALPLTQPLIPAIAIPTTYAGSEMTPVFGVTHHDEGETSRKVTVRDPRVTPKIVIYDPELTLNLPPEVTASSGINALAHCVEALYSKQRNPEASAAAVEGIRRIAAGLPKCTADGADQAAREEMLAGAHLAAVALSTTTVGLHHGLCHVLGGSADVPHGIANAIILPHAMRFNLEAARPELARVARSMGFVGETASDADAAEEAIGGMAKFIAGLGLPQRLRDVGVAEKVLGELGRVAVKSKAVQENVRSIKDARQAEEIFRAAW